MQLIMVLVCTYTANLASDITTATIQSISNSNLTSLSGLPGTTNAFTSSIYVENLALRQQVAASTLNWTGEDTFQEIMSLLTSKAMAAYVYDRPTLAYYNGQNNCGLNLLSGYVDPLAYGFAFVNGFSDVMFSDFNRAMASPQSVVKLDSLAKIQLAQAIQGNCNSSSSSVSSGSTSVQFAMVSGLWVILAASVCVMLLASCFGVFQHHILPGAWRSRPKGYEDADIGLDAAPSTWYSHLARNFLHRVPPDAARDEIERIETSGMSLVPPMLRKRALDNQFG